MTGSWSHEFFSYLHKMFSVPVLVSPRAAHCLFRPPHPSLSSAAAPPRLLLNNNSVNWILLFTHSSEEAVLCFHMNRGHLRAKPSLSSIDLWLADTPHHNIQSLVIMMFLGIVAGDHVALATFPHLTLNANACGDMESLCNVASLFTLWALLETGGGMSTLAEANRWFWNWITFTWLHQSCADHPIITKHLPSCYYIDPLLWWCDVRCHSALIQALFHM